MMRWPGRALARYSRVCTEHPHRPTVDHCDACLRLYSRECLVRGGPQSLCRVCVARVCVAVARAQTAAALRRRHPGYRLARAVQEQRGGLLAAGLVVLGLALLSTVVASSSGNPRGQAAVADALCAVAMADRARLGRFMALGVRPWWRSPRAMAARAARMAPATWWSGATRTPEAGARSRPACSRNSSSPCASRSLWLALPSAICRHHCRSRGLARWSCTCRSSRLRRTMRRSAGRRSGAGRWRWPPIRRSLCFRPLRRSTYACASCRGTGMPRSPPWEPSRWAAP